MFILHLIVILSDLQVMHFYLLLLTDKLKCKFKLFVEAVFWNYFPFYLGALCQARCLLVQARAA